MCPGHSLFVCDSITAATHRLYVLPGGRVDRGGIF
jgi:hypothetical protein